MTQHFVDEGPSKSPKLTFLHSKHQQEGGRTLTSLNISLALNLPHLKNLKELQLTSYRQETVQ